MESLSPDEIKTIVKEIHECEAVIEKSKICSGMQMEREKAKKAKRFLVKKLPAGFDYASAYKEYYKEAPDNYRYREETRTATLDVPLRKTRTATIKRSIRIRGASSENIRSS